MPFLKKRKYKENHTVLDLLIHLYKAMNQFEGAFYAELKKKNDEIFKFLEHHDIHFPISPNLIKLLKIDADKATHYMINSFGRYLSHSSLIETCVDELL